VLHQLRYVLGDSLFFASVQSYCSDTNVKFKSATIPDFIENVNQVTGSDYNWFFDQWIYQPNHPVYMNTYNFEGVDNNLWKVNYFMKQTQSNAPFFKMPVEVMIRFSDGTDTTFRVMNNVNNQYFSWLVNKQPIILVFDPDRNIVLKGGGTIVGTDFYEASENQTILHQNIPNPANGETIISYELAESTSVRLEFTSLKGHKAILLVNEIQQEGSHFVNLDCSTLPSGTYIYSLTTGKSVLHKKLVNLK
jgi:hypothetical protein